MSVWSDAYFKKLSRQIISPELEPDSGLPLDKKNLEARYVVVTKIFPYTNEVKCYERGDDPKNIFVSSLLSPMMSADMYQTWNPGVDMELDTDTNKMAITLKEPEIGLVVAINGDMNAIGSVCLGFLHMPGEPEIVPIVDGYAVKYNNSLIQITNTDTIELSAPHINIDSPNFTVNGGPAIGPTGPIGPQGPGPSDAQVEAAANIYLAANLVSEVTAAANAYLAAHVSTFKGDKGDKGDDGATGPQGPAFIVGNTSITIANVTAGVVGTQNVTIADTPPVSKILCFTTGGNQGTAQVSAVAGTTYTIQYKFDLTGTNRPIYIIWWG